MRAGRRSILANVSAAIVLFASAFVHAGPALSLFLAFTLFGVGALIVESAGHRIAGLLGWSALASASIFLGSEPAVVTGDPRWWLLSSTGWLWLVCVAFLWKSIPSPERRLFDRHPVEFYYSCAGTIGGALMIVIGGLGAGSGVIYLHEITPAVAQYAGTAIVGGFVIAVTRAGTRRFLLRAAS